jgi:phosphoribosylanthranilate isomerase
MFGEAAGANKGVRVKICGITNETDAQAATDLGADALGFNLFAGSRRYINIQSSAEWIAKLPAEICKVAVLVNPTLEEAIEIANLPFIDALQLHGCESPGFCKVLAERGIRFAKALPVGHNESLVEVPNFSTDTVLLDSVSEHGFGGSGEMFPWGTGRRFVESHPALKVILAGGLKPQNVAEAVQEVRPFAVDVASGVESSPGRKDRDRLRALFAALRLL